MEIVRLGIVEVDMGLTEIILILLALMLTVGVPLVVIGVVLFFTKRKQANMKMCGFCASAIPAQAIVGRFCGRDVAMNLGP